MNQRCIPRKENQLLLKEITKKNINFRFRLEEPCSRILMKHFKLMVIGEWTCKTTFLDLIAGLQLPESGTISVGRLLTENFPRWRTGIWLPATGIFFFIDGCLRDNLAGIATGT
jgi:ABC-type bacteriocin/lantibiotic exporter with double-glycine peptidase domain